MFFHIQDFFKSITTVVIYKEKSEILVFYKTQEQEILTL